VLNFVLDYNAKQKREPKLMSPSFEYEYQMIQPANDWLMSQDLVTKSEFSLPWGICDLVGCSFNKKHIQKRLQYGQTKPIGPQIRVLILSKIPDVHERKSILLNDLRKYFKNSLSLDKISFEANKLISDKFVQITNDGRLQKLNGWVPLQKKIMAIELKLNRIHDVLHQATCNLEFADESFAGLPFEVAHRLIERKKVEHFAQKGIGILGIKSDKCEVLLQPNPMKSKPNPVLQTHCVERFWRTRIKGNST